MGKPKFVHKQKIIKISEQQQQLLDELLDKGFFVVEAEAFRQGLVLLHATKCPPTPPYRQPSVNQQIKQEKLHKEAVTRSIPDEQFVEQNLKDVFLYTDEDQIKWILFRKLGNYVGAVLLSGVKEWVRRKDPEFLWHVGKSDDVNVSYEKELEDPTVRKVLQEQYGVAITV